MNRHDLSCAVVVASACLALLAGAARANLITNGDFSAGSTGWSTNGTAAIGSGYATLGSGGDNRGAVYQTIATTAGQWYSVTYFKGHGGVDINSALMVTAFNGTGIATANAYWGESYNGLNNDLVTRYFQAEGSTTTLQFRDFNYSGASHDVRVDNIVVEAVDRALAFASNIAGQATLTQSDFFNAGSYPSSNGTDGVPNNFMHTTTSAPKWYDLTFADPISVDRVVVTPREGFLSRAGDQVFFYDADDVQIGSAVALGDGSFIYTNDLIRQPVSRIRVVENGSAALNFAEIEVYAVQATGGGPASLIDQSFATNAQLNADRVNVDWFDNDGGPTTFETYGPGGASARQMASTYDHDNNAATPNVDIVGGIEVNDAGSNLTLTAVVDLPLLPATYGGFIEFWAGLRGSPAGDQTFDIVNVTDSRDIVLGQVISVPAAVGSTREWVYNNFYVPFIADDLGDEIQVRFHATGNGAEGLQLTDLQLTLYVPSPAALPVGLVGLLALAARRTRPSRVRQ